MTVQVLKMLSIGNRYVLAPLSYRCITSLQGPRSGVVISNFPHYSKVPNCSYQTRDASAWISNFDTNGRYPLRPRWYGNDSFLKAPGLSIRAMASRKGSFNPSKKGDLSKGSEDDQRARKQLALESVMADINNSFGQGSVAQLGTTGGALVETFPSGNLALDVALGGGLPKGRIVEIYGPESSGKTTLALHAVASIQKEGGFAALIDAEHAFDESYARCLGVNVEDLILIQPDSGEMALEAADMMIRSRSVSLICVDSVSALIPKAELEGEIGQSQIGLQARLMSSSLRKLATNASKAGCTIIFLNQIRHKIGVFYGSPETTSGGNALKFYASIRMDVRSTSKIKASKPESKGEEDIGIHCRVKIVKSKVSRPYRQAEFDILFGTGVSRLNCVADCSEAMGLVVKKGTWYSYNENNLGQGRDKLLQFLADNPQVCDELEQRVREKVAEDSRRFKNPGAPVDAFVDTDIPDSLMPGVDFEESDVESLV